MTRKNKRTSKIRLTNKEARKLNRLTFTKETTIEEKLKTLSICNFDEVDGNLGYALIDYMARLEITEEDLHERTELSVRQISRIRKNRIKEVPLPTVVALCIGMQLEFSDSVFLIEIAGYSLEKQSKDVQMYKALLLEADISVEQCNILLLNMECLPLTGRKKQKGARHTNV